LIPFPSQSGLAPRELGSWDNGNTFPNAPTADGGAAKYNREDQSRWLVDHGVDVNAPDTRLQRRPYELALLNGIMETA